mgnify:CR=1 FL=1
MKYTLAHVQPALSHPPTSIEQSPAPGMTQTGASWTQTTVIITT